MNITGVVAEYNPFHNGHSYQLNEIRRNNSAVVVVMSGNYVERSETALFSKKYRTETALRNGADLVIELPLCYATASAEKFSFGGIYLLNSLGVVNSVLFGSECGNITKLGEAALAVSLPTTDKLIKQELEKGVSYPVARYNAVKKLFGVETADILSLPNNILGVEYIKALNTLNSTIVPKTIRRMGEGHGSLITKGFIISASAIRKMVFAHENIESYVPDSVCEVIEKAKNNNDFPSDLRKLETAVLASLRQKTSEDFKDVPDVSEGIENRILEAARTATTLEELYLKAKTKRYTHSRIRRIVLFSFLNIKNDVYNELPQYIRVLGFNKKGTEILKAAKNSATLPIVMSASDIKKLPRKAQVQYELECKSTDIFNMTLPEIMHCGTEMTDNIVKFE